MPYLNSENKLKEHTAYPIGTYSPKPIICTVKHSTITFARKVWLTDAIFMP